MKRIFAFLGAFALCATTASASSLASDSAADPVYDDGWQTGDNGGSGWGGGWILGGGGPGTIHEAFIGDSSTNQSGQNLPPAGDINTPQTPGGRAWGSITSDAAAVTAVRTFVGLLNVGQTFSLDFDNSTFAPEFGFSLGNAMNGRFGFLFNRDSQELATYSFSDATGSHTLGLPPTNQGLHIEFTLTSESTYSAIFTGLSGGSESISGTLRDSTLPGIDRVSLRDANGNEDGNYINNIRIVPEPRTYLLLSFALGLGAISRRRISKF